jgi:transposase
MFWQNMAVPPISAHQIVLSIDERAALLALIRPTGQARMLLRARIVLAAADGGTNAGIARDLAVCADTVRKWRCRYARDRLAGLADAHRPGRPRRFSAVQRAQVTAIACELPATRGMPLSRCRTTSSSTRTSRWSAPRSRRRRTTTARGSAAPRANRYGQPQSHLRPAPSTTVIDLVAVRGSGPRPRYGLPTNRCVRCRRRHQPSRARFTAGG